jgi:hypothetical protein
MGQGWHREMAAQVIDGTVEPFACMYCLEIKVPGEDVEI